ncbi:MAG TPA: S9 family peptidase [Longimicrobiales bacterium]|nr:S9 family peptidase [Longimicrobiales bacterium]
MTRHLAAVLTLLLIVAVPASAQERGILPQDYYRMTFVGDVDVSPAGDLVAFTVTSVDEEENERHREVWLQRLRDGRPDGAPFRFTDPTRESSSPRFSPDGDLLAFTSRRGDDDNAVWFARLRAPGGEAFHIDGVDASPAWSPDGRWIAVVKEPEEEEGDEGEEDRREGWIAPDAITTTLDAKRFDGRVITHLRYKRDGVLTLRPHPSVSGKDQLFVLPGEGGEPRQITSLPFSVRSAVWSNDGSRLYFAGDPHEDEELRTDATGALYMVARAGGEPIRLTPIDGSESSPALSPDGRWLAFLSTPERGAETDLMVARLGADGAFAGEPVNLTADWDLSPGSPTFSPDGRTLRFSTGVAGASHLFEVPVAGGAVRQATRGERRLSSFAWSRDGRVMAYTAGDASTPAEVFVARGDGAGEQRLTSFNDAWLAEVTIMPSERLTWTVADGTEVEGWLVKPVGYDPARRYPMILKIHGGPHSAYGNTFFQTFHVLSNAGFFVLYPNPRGSSGYGHGFQYATRGQWGELDSEDYLTGVDAALAKYPAIDPERLGVSGGSYGGYMTNWLTATTDRFAAAATSRSITNWESWYGVSDAQGLTEYEFMGTPWEQRELYRRLSPISYVENVQAPTLIIHSENDYRTPIADGEQWYVALKKRGVPVEMVRYPRSSHGLSRTGEPWLLVDRLERIRSWFDHWLIEQPVRTAEGAR